MQMALKQLTPTTCHAQMRARAQAPLLRRCRLPGCLRCVSNLRFPLALRDESCSLHETARSGLTTAMGIRSRRALAHVRPKRRQALQRTRSGALVEVAAAMSCAAAAGTRAIAATAASAAFAIVAASPTTAPATASIASASAMMRTVEDQWCLGMCSGMMTSGQRCHAPYSPTAAQPCT